MSREANKQENKKSKEKERSEKEIKGITFREFMRVSCKSDY